MITEQEQKVNEILEDFSKHKSFAIKLQNMLADSYKVAGKETTKGVYVRNCGSSLIFKRYHDEANTIQLDSANFCKNRLCPFCAWRWHLKYSRIIEKAFNILELQNFYHLVLTIPNVTDLSKKFLLDLRQKATYFLKNVLKCKDYMISFEITIDKFGRYHPHYHIISIFKKPPTRKFLQTEWAKVSKCNNKYAICDIKKCSDNKVSQELTKYILKFEDCEINMEQLRTIDSALFGTRKFSTSGAIKKAETEAKMEIEIQNQDEIAELSAYDSELLFFKWFEGSYMFEGVRHH